MWTRFLTAILPNRYRAGSTASHEPAEKREVRAIARNPFEPLLHLENPRTEREAAVVREHLHEIRDSDRALSLLLRGEDWLRELIAQAVRLDALNEQAREVLHRSPALLSAFSKRDDLNAVDWQRAERTAIRHLHDLRGEATPKANSALAHLSEVLSRAERPGGITPEPLLHDLVAVATTLSVRLNSDREGYALELTPAARVAFRALAESRGLTAEMQVTLMRAYRDLGREDARDLLRTLIHHPDAHPVLWQALLHRSADNDLKAEIARIPSAREDERSRQHLLESWQTDIVVLMFDQLDPEMMAKRFEHLARYNGEAALSLVERDVGGCRGVLRATHLKPLLESTNQELRLRAISALSHLNVPSQEGDEMPHVAPVVVQSARR